MVSSQALFRSNKPQLWIALFLSTLATASSAAPLTISEVKREAPIDFAKDVYPLLKRSCLACHNTTKAKAGLNLESPASILKGGETGPAAITGKGLESLLVRSAAHLEEAAMPPPGNKVNAPNLTSDELGLLKLWIDQGLKGGPVSDNIAQWRGYPAAGAPVNAAALSGSGRIAAAARGNQVQLTEVATGISLGLLVDPELAKLDLYKDKLPADRDAVMSVAFGGDDLLATGGFRTVRLWRRLPLAELRPATELPSSPTSFATSAQYAAAGDEAGIIRLWEPSAEKPSFREFKDHTTPIKALTFSPDGLWLASAASDRSFRIWSTVDASVVYQTESPAVITSLTFLKNGTELVAAFADGMLRVYPFPKEAPATPPAPLREWKLQDQAITALAAPDPAGTQIIWINQEPILHLTETLDGKRLADKPLENPAKQSITTSERRQQAAQRTLDARKARLTASTEAVKKETENLRATHLAQEKARADWQRKLTAAQAATESLRAAAADKPRQEAQKKTSTEATTAERAFSDTRTNAELAVRLTGQAMQKQAASDGAATAAESALAEGAAALEALKKALPALTAPKSFTLLDNGKVALIAMEGGRLQWHAVSTGELLDAAEVPALGVATTLLSATTKGLLVARPDKKIVTLPTRRTFTMERMIGNPDDATTLASRITALSFSSDTRLLASGGGVPSRTGEVKVWNTADGKPVLTLTDPHSDTVNALSFSPDDSLIATAGSDRWARVFQVTDGSRMAAFEGHSGQVLSIAWRSDGLALATGGADKTLRYWDLLDNKQTKSITSFSKEVSGIAWLGTGDTVASANGDAAVKLNEEALPGNKGFAFTLTADPSGKLVAVGGEDGILRIWQTAAKKLLREIQYH
jgi:WD40 repeat protein